MSGFAPRNKRGNVSNVQLNRKLNLQHSEIETIRDRLEFFEGRLSTIEYQLKKLLGEQHQD